MENLITKIFGTKHDRDVKKLRPLVDEINAEYEKLACTYRRTAHRQNR